MIEAADQKIVDCRHATLEANARFEKLEVELQSSKRRIVLITKDLEAAHERFGHSDEKCVKATATSEEAEIAREQLENEELSIEENIEKLEENIKDMKRKLELNSGKFVECERKVEVCNNDVARIQKQAEISEARVKVLEGVIEDHGKSLVELEDREGEISEKEELNEEKINYLEGELKETIVRAEAAERNSAVFQNNMMMTETEINNWVKMREDMQQSMLTMDDVADDPAYLVFSTGNADSDSRPGSVNAISSMFGAKSGGDDSGDGDSRSNSRTAEPELSDGSETPPREQTPAPVVMAEPEPELQSPPEPEPEEEEEEGSEEDSDDGWD